MSTYTGQSCSLRKRSYGWRRIQYSLFVRHWLIRRVKASHPIELGRTVCGRSEEHTSGLQSPCNLVFRLLLEKKKTESDPPDMLSTDDGGSEYVTTADYL